MNFLSARFSVQVSGLAPDSVVNMIELVEPDIAVISLVGATDVSNVLFNRLQSEYPWLPVVTVGTEAEKDKFIRYFNNAQFENVARPIDNMRLLAAVNRRLPDTAKKPVRDSVTEHGDDGGEDGSGKKRVLIVDDEIINREILKNILLQHYYHHL